MTLKGPLALGEPNEQVRVEQTHLKTNDDELFQGRNVTRLQVELKVGKCASGRQKGIRVLDK